MRLKSLWGLELPMEASLHLQGGTCQEHGTAGSVPQVEGVLHHLSPRPAQSTMGQVTLSRLLSLVSIMMSPEIKKKKKFSSCISVCLHCLWSWHCWEEPGPAFFNPHVVLNTWVRPAWASLSQAGWPPCMRDALVPSHLQGPSLGSPQYTHLSRVLRVPELICTRQKSPAVTWATHRV